MYFYYFTILFLFLPAFFETAFPESRGKIPFKKLFLWFSFSVITLQMGLRWETGSDWLPYINHFYSQDLSTPFVNNENGYEAGYNFFVSVFKFITPEYSFLLFVHAVIFFLLLKKSYQFFTPYSLVAVLLFYVTFLGIWGSSRQLLAVVIGLLGLICLYEKKWLAYGICVLLAFQFHSSSLLLLIFIFLRKKFDNYLILGVALSCLIIGFSPLPLKIFSLTGGFNEHTASKAEAYLELAKAENSAVSVIGIAKRILIFSFFFIFRNKISENYPKFNFVFNGYFVSLCFYFMFASSLSVMISRGSLYFNIFEPLLLSYIFCLTKNRKVGLIMIITLLIYCFITINQSIATYPQLFDPYKGIFFNEDLNRTDF